MSSKKTLDVDFERDLPTTAEDVEALARARQHRPLPTDVYLKWLTQMSEGPRSTPRLNTDSDEPFEL
jgi:hypothetical protein